MPTLMKDWQLADAFIGGKPSPATGTEKPRPWVENATSLPLFHPTPDDQLLAFHVTLFRTTNEDDMHSFVFFILRTELLRLQTLYKQHFGIPQGSEAPFLPYSVWGSNRTHWLSDHYVDWQNSVYGYRTVELVNESSMLFWEPRKIRVRDFNPSLLFFHSPPPVSVEEEGDGNERNPEKRGPFILCPAESELPVTRPFAECLGKGLPHKEVVSEKEFQATEVMMDEGRILLFSRVSCSEYLVLVEVDRLLLASATAEIYYGSKFLSCRRPRASVNPLAISTTYLV